MKVQVSRWMVFCLLGLGLAVLPALAQDEQPASVIVIGTLQMALGCPANEDLACADTALAYDPTHDLWSATFELPAGSYEYRVALNGDAEQIFGRGAERGGESIALELEEDTRVRFLYSSRTNWIADTVNHILANVPGSFQSEIGCPGDWQPSCLRTWLQDPDGDGVYTFVTTDIPAGFYEAKVAFNESWALNYGERGLRDGPNIGFTVLNDGDEVVFSFDTATNIMTISVAGEVGPAAGNLFLSQAYWVTRDTLAWNIGRIPGAVYRLHFSTTGDLTLGDNGVEGGDAILLRYDRSGLPAEVLARFPHLRDYFALRIAEEDFERIPEMLTGQLAVSATINDDTVLHDATGVQIPGVLDDLYRYDGDLGVTFIDDIPTLTVWAPTAQQVRLHLFADSDPQTTAEIFEMTRDDAYGTWSITGDANWYGRYYLYEVTVYAPSVRSVVTNLVTDPYSHSLSMNSARSQIIDLDDPALLPPGWDELVKPPLAAPEDIVIYELHVRDFSIFDESVSPQNRGTFRAFTETESNGMRHLRTLAEAGLTHIHLLPVFDIATINENPAERIEPDRELLATFPPDSDQQQAIIEPLRDLDGFNWGYDPLHFTAPEGSYSTDPDGPQRILEFREMVQALNESGLRVVMDVVYNHTNAAGQSERSVLDRIVPGYYHRLNADGRVETSTCCPNTATEHYMMERLMIDSVLTWATAYRVDGFRFDLMGHHMRDNMLALRAQLDALTLAEDGVDGPSIYVYGEGWNFGEVADNRRGINATQINMAGTGIGTFNDRLRDAARGGNPFGGWQEQGFINGLYYDPNEVETRSAEQQRAQILHFSDQIRVGLAGNLADYLFINAQGELATGADIDYNGQPAGYTRDPQEHIVYVSAHDNETLFDAIQLKAPLTATPEERVRMQNLGLSLVTLAQGIPFIHAGDDILRSKSMDRDSYNSGDWFNAIDWTYQTNNWGRGLPPAEKNRENWPIMAPLLANPDLVVDTEHMLAAHAHLREMLQIRFSSPLFRLQTAEDIQQRLAFHNTGPDQIPGVIVMSLSDLEGEALDPNYTMIVVIFNATTETIAFPAGELATQNFRLHPVQANSADLIVREASYADGSFTVPPRTTAVFVLEA